MNGENVLLLLPEGDTQDQSPRGDRQQQAQQQPTHPGRRAAIQALIEQGATEGERDAARRALERIELEEYEDALSHGAA